jgi:hypothetical protein
MIRYALVCHQDHEFDGWFRSSSDFDAQAKAGFVTCPLCGSTSVGRALMAPSVQTARSRAAEPVVENSAPAAPAPVVEQVPPPPPTLIAPDPAQKAVLEALADLRRKVMESADYVGDQFAEEARKMHYGEIDQRGIYGEATAEDARALADEGIEIHALPVLPDDRN